MLESKNKFVIVQPGDEKLWESAEDCPFPLGELKPSEPLNAADLAALKVQIREKGSCG